MTTIEEFTLRLEVAGSLTDADRDSVARAIRDAIEHWRSNEGLTPICSDGTVLSVAAVLPSPNPDGPYRPELAEAFRQGARELKIDALEVSSNAAVMETHGDGAFVACRIFVSDAERAPLPGEDCA